MKPDLLNDSRWEKSTNFGFHGEHEEEMLEILLREVKWFRHGFQKSTTPVANVC